MLLGTFTVEDMEKGLEMNCGLFFWFFVVFLKSIFIDLN